MGGLSFNGYSSYPLMALAAIQTGSIGDNTSVFRTTSTIVTPDLSTVLILQMDLLRA